MGNFLVFLILTSLLVTAIVQAVQGDWLPAIFFAILWVGGAQNFGLSELRS